MSKQLEPVKCGCGRKPDIVQNVDWDLPWSIRCHSSPDHAFVVYGDTKTDAIRRWNKLLSASETHENAR